MEVASIEEKAKEGPETYRQGNDVDRIVNRFSMFSPNSKQEMIIFHC